MTDAEWLNGLKYGDDVVVSGYHGKSLGRVSRTTNTQIVLESGSRYRRKDGRLVGGDLSVTRITTPTDELRAEILNGSVRKREGATKK